MAIEERVLAVGELAVMPEEGESLLSRGCNCLGWVPLPRRGIPHENLWYGPDEDTVRKSVLRDAAFFDATLIIWRQEPCLVDAFAATAIAAIWRPRKQSAPANNDGRATCFWCGGSTEKKQGFTAEYDICPKCKK